MPRALAIETSGRTGSVAIAKSGIVLAEEPFTHGLKHAAELVPMIDRLCRSNGWSPTDIEEIYVSAGPGSFTGLRVGITVAKTLAFATGAKVVGVPSGRVIAHNSPDEATNVIIVLDAKRDQIFTARYTRSSPTQEWLEADVPHLDSLEAMLSRSGRPVWLIGEGIPFHRKFIPAADGDVRVIDEAAWPGRAMEVVRIGFQMARKNQFTSPDRLNPIYIRKPEAEEKWEMLNPQSVMPSIT